MDYEQVFRESYQRVLNRRTSEEREFFDAFYDRFIAADPEVAAKFKGVDMEAQKTLLRQSLIHLLHLSNTKRIPGGMLEIARRHDRRHADIPPRLYQIWLESLIQTVRETDPQCNADVELAWRMICAQGITYMTFMHDGSSA